jgi:predicted DNA-binding transcriptional regulator YafY
MPRVKNQSFRIKIIDDLLSRKNWVTTSVIKRTIELKINQTVSIRTIQQDITDMKEDTRLGYFAPITYNKSRRAFTYDEPEYTIKNFALSPTEVDALKFYAECLQVFSGYKLFDAFTSGIEKVINGVQARSVLKPTSNAKLIIQTDSLVTPRGDEFMGDMVYAIDNRLKCEIEYQPYDREDISKRQILPLLLKEYRNRWYLLSFRLDSSRIRTYALDRIKRFSKTDEVLEEIKEFDSAKYFNHSFGITTPNTKVETIVLKFSKDQIPYIKSLPVHKTQQVLKETKQSITISISVILSYEVYEFILSKSPDVKVLSPSSLAREIAEKLNKSASQYNF